MSLEYYFVVIITFVLSTVAVAFAPDRGTRIQLETGEVRYRPEKIAAFAIAIVLIIVAGCRYYVGTDYGAYYTSFSGTWDALVDRVVEYDEPVIALIAFIARHVYDDGAAVIFLAALLTIACYIYQIYKHSPNFIVSIMLYLFVGQWAGCFNGVRQYLAAAILFMGHRFILERKLKHYAIVVLLASLAHTTALVMIFPYFVLTRKISRVQLIFFAIGALVVSQASDLIFGFIGLYKESQLTLEGYIVNEVSIFRILVGFVPLLIYWLFSKKSGNSAETEFYLNGMVLNAFAMAATMNSAYLARIGIYTSIFVPIGYAHLFRAIKLKNNQFILMICMFVFYFFYWQYEISGSWALQTFKWIWER